MTIPAPISGMANFKIRLKLSRSKRNPLLRFASSDDTTTAVVELIRNRMIGSQKFWITKLNGITAINETAGGDIARIATGL